jgi:hypothetical protein
VEVANKGFVSMGLASKQRIQTFTTLLAAVWLVKHLKLSRYRLRVGGCRGWELLHTFQPPSALKPAQPSTLYQYSWKIALHFFSGQNRKYERRVHHDDACSSDPFSYFWDALASVQIPK